MPRHPRIAPGGLVYHVLNRSVGRMKMFRSAKDFAAFHQLLIDAHQRTPIGLLGNLRRWESLIIAWGRPCKSMRR